MEEMKICGGYTILGNSRYAPVKVWYRDEIRYGVLKETRMLSWVWVKYSVVFQDKDGNEFYDLEHCQEHIEEVAKEFAEFQKS